MSIVCELFEIIDDDVQPTVFLQCSTHSNPQSRPICIESIHQEPNLPCDIASSPYLDGMIFSP